jgi:septal ring factor EnvC (AmiA/AmiB activator)
VRPNRSITVAFVDAANDDPYRRSKEGSAAAAALLTIAGHVMARRRATKARSKSASAGARTPRSKAARGQKTSAATATEDGGLRQRLAAVERERDQLKADLDRSCARLKQLEDTQAQVRDRIAWALDSLHNILEGKG